MCNCENCRPLDVYFVIENNNDRRDLLSILATAGYNVVVRNKKIVVVENVRPVPSAHDEDEEDNNPQMQAFMMKIMKSMNPGAGQKD